ncbi:unnamed protein product [Rhizoctonia solani]|uniref:Uncharacterized protein n=1 Tax=Rhizoctonia solani TaxID=456999 RepID=A0A8H2WGN1_9AGAM|nr:unnamed protein product [Rhizoctonia solani]
MTSIIVDSSLLLFRVPESRCCVSTRTQQNLDSGRLALQPSCKRTVLEIKVVWEVSVFWQLEAYDAIAQDLFVECRAGQKVIFNRSFQLLTSLTCSPSAMSRDAKTVAGWDFDRIIPCHGDVIESGGKAAWCEAFKWYLEENFKA